MHFMKGIQIREIQVPRVATAARPAFVFYRILKNVSLAGIPMIFQEFFKPDIREGMIQ
jgi:hypothetical protein